MILIDLNNSFISFQECRKRKMEVRADYELNFGGDRKRRVTTNVSQD